MAKVLFISHRIPYPPNKGDKIRSFHEIKHLAKRHELHLLAFYEYPEELQYREDLQQYCRTVTLVPLIGWKQRIRAVNAMLYRKPWSIGYYSSSSMKKAVREKIRSVSPDLIFVYCSSMAPYAGAAPGIPKILDFVDSDALKWRQYSRARRLPFSWLYGYEAKKLSAFELELIDEFDSSIFVSRSEVSWHEGKSQQPKMAFIQNGIDLDFFQPPADKTVEPAIAFTGAMDYYPNIDAALFFAHEVFPKILEVHRKARYIIIGSRPVAAIRKLSGLPGITVTGTVKDVRPFLSQCSVAVVPLRIAQGIQNKILEALAVGLPVVTTTAAAGDLAAVREFPLAVAAGPDSFANHVLRFLDTAPLAPETVDACRRQLRSRYDWKTNLSALEEIIERVKSGKNRAPNPSIENVSAVQARG